MEITITQDNKHYRIPVRRDMSYLLTDEVLDAFEWQDDTEDTSDEWKELEDC